MPVLESLSFYDMQYILWILQNLREEINDRFFHELVVSVDVKIHSFSQFKKTIINIKSILKISVCSDIVSIFF